MWQYACRSGGDGAAGLAAGEQRTRELYRASRMTKFSACCSRSCRWAYASDAGRLGRGHSKLGQDRV
jgi:hypothetical protein